MDELTRQMEISGEKVLTETVTSTTRLTSLPPKGTSGSNHRNMSSGAGGLGFEKNVLTQNSSGTYFSSSSIGVTSNYSSSSGIYLGGDSSGGGEGGGSYIDGEGYGSGGGGGGGRGGSSGSTYLVSSVSKVRSSSSGGARRAQTGGTSVGLSPGFRERKTIASRSGGYDGSSSGNSSPEFSRKDYGNYCSGATRGRSESRESEIRARLQSASPSAGRWAELEDVKKLLKGRSSSVSPTRSSASVTLPVPKKASVETKTVSVATQSASTLFEPVAQMNGFNTIDVSGLYDSRLTSRQRDSGVQTGQHTVTVKSCHCDAGVKSSQYDVSLSSGQYDAGLKSSQYDVCLSSGQYDTGLKSGRYDMSLKSGQYDTAGRSGQYDTAGRSGQYDTAGRSGQYDTLDSAFPTFSWSTSTLPSSSSTTVVAGNTSSYTYQLGQVSANNRSGGSPPLSPVPQQSLSVYGFQNNLAPTSIGVLTTSGGNVTTNLGGYGVQKNVSNGSAVISSGISTGKHKRDCLFVWI
uniref:Uncharacterized protein n=1 Tax=Poecilia mexicana TaxID=48701 RepID=A0A3B3XZR4_9TELE